MANKAFSDLPSGFGLYNNGQIMNGTDTKSYGPSFGDGDVIGVHLDIVNGLLSFSLNGKHLGIAFNSTQLKQLYATVSFTHKADFTLALYDKDPLIS